MEHVVTAAPGPVSVFVADDQGELVAAAMKPDHDGYAAMMAR